MKNQRRRPGANTRPPENRSVTERTTTGLPCRRFFASFGASQHVSAPPTRPRIPLRPRRHPLPDGRHQCYNHHLRRLHQRNHPTPDRPNPTPAASPCSPESSRRAGNQHTGPGCDEFRQYKPSGAARTLRCGVRIRVTNRDVECRILSPWAKSGAIRGIGSTCWETVADCARCPAATYG
jgi:hypothetical protein